MSLALTKEQLSPDRFNRESESPELISRRKKYLVIENANDNANSISYTLVISFPLSSSDGRRIGQMKWKAEALSLAELKFKMLAKEWYRETGMISLLHKKTLHPAYQKIIGMGKPAVGFILRELEKNGGHWLWALCAITDEDPAKGKTSFSDAKIAWIDWGKKNGYI